MGPIYLSIRGSSVQMDDTEQPSAYVYVLVGYTEHSTVEKKCSETALDIERLYQKAATLTMNFAAAILLARECFAAQNGEHCKREHYACWVGNQTNTQERKNKKKNKKKVGVI